MGYATKMFEEFELTTHNLVVILMMPSLKMILDMGTLEVDFHMYQRMIEKLNFLILTTFVLNQVSRISNQTKIFK
jgi:hypothetical protein